MRRDLVINFLVLDCVNKIIERRHTLWLHLILTNGFSGFANMSDAELRRTYAERGLLCEEGFDDDANDDDDDDEDEREVRNLLPATRYSEVPECR